MTEPDPRRVHQRRRFNRFLNDISGVIHIGASHGQERYFYDRFGLEVLWIEPIPEVFAQLEANIAELPHQRALQALITDQDGALYDFNVADNDGMSSSIFDFKHHTEIWPQVKMSATLQITSTTLATLLATHGIDPSSYQGLVLDTQGAELMVLKGCGALLPSFRFVKTEAANFEVYDGSCLLSDLEAFMTDNGYKETSRQAFGARSESESCFNIVYERSSTPSLHTELTAARQAKDASAIELVAARAVKLLTPSQANLWSIRCAEALYSLRENKRARVVLRSATKDLSPSLRGRLVSMRLRDEERDMTNDQVLSHVRRANRNGALGPHEARAALARLKIPPAGRSHSAIRRVAPELSVRPHNSEAVALSLERPLDGAPLPSVGTTGDAHYALTSAMRRAASQAAEDETLLDVRDGLLDTRKGGLAVWDQSRVIDGTADRIGLARALAVGAPSPAGDTVEEPTIVAIDTFRGSNYCHWIFDGFTRAQTLLEGFDLDPAGVRVIVPAKSRFIVDSLSGLGIDEDQLHLASDRAQQFRRLLFSTTSTVVHHPAGRGDPARLGRMRAALLPLAAQSGKSQPSRVYISRRDATKRRLTNEEQVEAFLQERGFNIVCPGQFSLADQIRTFEQAELVVGVHGAGMTNAAFARTDASIVEILPPDYGTASFFWPTIGLGQTYTAIVNSPEELAPVPGRHALGGASAFSVDLDALEQLIG